LQLDERASRVAARDDRATGIPAGLAQPLAPEKEVEGWQGLTEVQMAQRGQVQSVALAMCVA
jgi:hypothetical protein